MRLRSLFLIALVAGASLAPATGASAQRERTGTVIRLIEAPESRRDDPRARYYIVDHVAPGTKFSRTIEVTNDTDGPVSLQLYDAAATIENGSFSVQEGRAENQLTTWVTVSPSSVQLAPDESARAQVSFDVPSNAPDGEFYGAALAERGPRESGGSVGVATRVGIRIYLSVGTGREPVSDFRIESLTGERRADGTPVVRASVVNTGGRALDLQADLRLRDGPGGTSAGPFQADIQTTLQPRARAPVIVLLDPALPDGPWLAVMTGRSGALERAAQATLVFPRPGVAAQPVPAQPVPVPEPAPAPGDGAPGEGDEGSGPGSGTDPGERVDGDGEPWTIRLLALLLLLLVLLLLLFLFVWKRRKKDEEEEDGDTPAGGAAEPAPSP